MKKERKIIKGLFNKIEITNNLFELNEIGSLKNAYSENIHVFESNNELFETIIITVLEKDNLKKISFSGDSFNISLFDLRDLYGNYEIAYNFRDNYTGFFFLNVKGKKISKIYCEKKNKIVKEQECFFEHFQKSKSVASFTEKEIIFNNIIFEVYSTSDERSL